jgi:hypothetical protein
MKLDSRPDCPKCGRLLDGATSPDNLARKPKNGDISICVYCLSINEFSVNDKGEMQLIAFTKERIEEFRKKFPDEFELIINYRIAIAQAKANNNFPL